MNRRDFLKAMGMGAAAAVIPWRLLRSKGGTEKAMLLPGTLGHVEGFTGTPVGQVFPYLGTAVPDGWLVCDGQGVKMRDYPELWELMGNTYGGEQPVEYHEKLQTEYAELRYIMRARSAV